MTTVTARARLIARIHASAAEALSLEEIGREILPLFESLIGSSRMLLYRSLEGQAFLPVAGAQECLPEYVAQFAAQDPLQHFLQVQNPVLLSATRCRAWEEFKKNPALVEFYRRWDLSRLLHLRLTETGHMHPGHAAIVCGRSAKQKDFTAADLQATRSVLPALNAALRRSARLSQKLNSASAIEALFERGETRAILALDLDGKPLWISSRAQLLLSPYLGSQRQMPDTLLAAVRNLARHVQGEFSVQERQTSLRVTLRGHSGARLEGELYLERNTVGDFFVAVDFGGAEATPGLLEIAERHRLTRAETEVLGDLARGCSDAEIAGHRFVSVATVRTHVTRILQKLEVDSRLQAAALTLGARRRTSSCRQGSPVRITQS